MWSSPIESENKWRNRKCSNCGTRKTSMWRRSSVDNILCNACGIYERTRLIPRPRTSSRRKPQLAATPHEHISNKSHRENHETLDEISTHSTDRPQIVSPSPPPIHHYLQSAETEKYTPVVLPGTDTVLVYKRACKNCGTTVTSMWRRDNDYNMICNSCGLFFKFHGYHRPERMWSSRIRRRQRSYSPVEMADTQSTPSNRSPQHDEIGSKVVRDTTKLRLSSHRDQDGNVSSTTVDGSSRRSLSIEFLLTPLPLLDRPKMNPGAASLDL
ncbi:hypothetical protein BJX96DRAFT_104656 [Aspergillus floccosus]